MKKTCENVRSCISNFLFTDFEEPFDSEYRGFMGSRENISMVHVEGGMLTIVKSFYKGSVACVRISGILID